MTTHPLTGVWTELVTPFSHTLQIDFPSIRRLVDAQAAHGIQGIYIHGISAETLSMTEKEQVELVAAGVKAADGRIPVMANLMCAGKARALELLDAFAGCGASYICASQPLLLPCGEEALFDYFAEIIRRAPVPVCLYNMPQAGYTVPPRLVGRLARTFPNFLGYKDSTQNIIHLQSVMGEVERTDFSVLAGSDATFYARLSVGGAGIVSLISLIFPDPLTGLYDAWQRGDHKAAFQRQLFVMKVRDALKSAPLIAGYKTMVRHLALFETDLVRAPLSSASQGQAEALLRQLESLGVI